MERTSALKHRNSAWCTRCGAVRAPAPAPTRGAALRGALAYRVRGLPKDASVCLGTRHDGCDGACTVRSLLIDVVRLAYTSMLEMFPATMYVCVCVWKVEHKVQG